MLKHTSRLMHQFVYTELVNITARCSWIKGNKWEDKKVNLWWARRDRGMQPSCLNKSKAIEVEFGWVDCFSWWDFWGKVCGFKWMRIIGKLQFSWVSTMFACRAFFNYPSYQRFSFRLWISMPLATQITVKGNKVHSSIAQFLWRYFCMRLLEDNKAFPEQNVWNQQATDSGMERERVVKVKVICKIDDKTSAREEKLCL